MQQDPTSTSDISSIISNFCTEGEGFETEPYGSGHINETFYAKNSQAGGADYLLQRVNHQIFKDVPGLIKNIELVTDHLRKKTQNIPGASVHREVLTLIPTKEHRFYHRDQHGNYWRMYHFLHTNRYDVVQTELQASEGGKAFGKFQALLSDMEASLLTESIPHFHNIDMRLKRFDEAIAADVANRVKNVLPEILFLQERAATMRAILKEAEEKLPVRIIHNDTKFNNVLLDKNDRAQCVIDLDTVMPGYVAYDFGDAIRTIINTAAEDEKDLDNIRLNIPLFKAYTEGYFKEAGFFLSNPEIESLLKGVLLIPYEQTVRFLTDYIEGDIYYKIHFPEHNLQRTRAQLQLVRQLEDNYEALEEIVQEIAVASITDKIG